MYIANHTRNTSLAGSCIIADSFFTRFWGLMGKKDLPEGHGLLIVPCNSIHMLFMKFALDIVFIDENSCVVEVIENIQPWKATKIVWSAHSTLELPAGTVARSGTQVGDELVMGMSGDKRKTKDEGRGKL